MADLRARWVAASALVLAAGCGDDLPPEAPPAPTTTPTVELPDPLGPLPAPASVDSDRFATSDRCAQCHTASSESDAMTDAAGRDVSPVALWRSSVMALAARDPFYLAVFSQERLEHDADEVIERTCTRCHGPAGSEEHEQVGGWLTMDALTGGDSPTARLARDGVTCSLCHQIRAQGLGDSASFTGGFDVGFDRVIYGPHQSPVVEPMQFFVEYTPTRADHISDSALCATCHTVVVRPLGPDGSPTGSEVIEQAPYFEWRNSDFDTDGGSQAASCASCHMPTVDEDGVPIDTRIARANAPLIPRSPYGRHTLVGGNAYMLRLLDDHEDWAQTGLPAGELEEAALRTEGFLGTSAELAVAEASRQGGELAIDIAVTNLTGHKLPTGYPTRRVWLHLRVTQGGSTIFESGAHDERGALVAGSTRLDEPGVILPHRDTITASDQVAVYEAVLVDHAGEPTHQALAAAGYAKDNRLLPSGWSASDAYAGVTAPVGVDGDEDHLGGSDRVHYRIAGPPSGELTVEVALRYQPVTPSVIEALAVVPTPEAVRWSHMAADAPPTPVTIATATTTVP